MDDDGTRAEADARPLDERARAHGSARRTPSARLLRPVLAVGVIAALAGGALVAADARREPATQVTTGPTTTAPPTSTPRAPTTATPTIEATTTTVPRFEAPLAVSWDSLPEEGFVVFSEPGTLTLHGVDGAVVASAPSIVLPTEHPDSIVIERRGTDAVAVSMDDPLGAPAPDGCSQSEGPRQEASVGTPDGRVRASVCGFPSPDEIWLTVDDRTEVLSGPPPGIGSGFWTEVDPSPDGRWILAQWSGECSAPSAWLISTAGGTAESITGPAGYPLPSGMFGWIDGGHALVNLTEGDCSSGSSVSGIYDFDPDTGSLSLVHSLTDWHSITRWTKAP